MRAVLRANKAFFVLLTLAAFALRAFFVLKHPLVAGDSFVYGDIAKNWLEHGIFGMTEDGAATPTFIRLPGYPAFMAVAWLVAGVEHYGAVLWLQVVLDVANCFFIAALAYEMLRGSRCAEAGAKWAFVLSALCPFTAMYTAAALAETATIFFTAAGLWGYVRLRRRVTGGEPWGRAASLCGSTLGLALLMRPDSGLLLAIILAALGVAAVRRGSSAFLRAGIAVGCVAAMFLLPWTIRNWVTFHRLQPLVPVNANEPDEYVAHGFDHWIGTWLIDFESVMDVDWKVSSDAQGEAVDVNDLPSRAFDTPEQKQRTTQLFAQYNEALVLSPELDAQFEELARERTQRHWFRTRVVLPLSRVADMWLRPRTETLNLDLDWWVWRDRKETLQSLALAALNLGYLLLALASLRFRRCACGYWLLWVFIVARSMMLLMLTNPEPRYTLECFPAVIAMGSLTLAQIRTKNDIVASS